MTVPGRPTPGLAREEARELSATLPRALTEVRPEALSRSDDTPVEETEVKEQHGWPPPSLVVVDDDDVVREAMRDLLRDMGMEVIGEAANGADGVRLALELRPDVVLMDLRMPGISGLEATSQIKSSDREVQVIVLTAYDDPALKSGAVKAGVYAYLVKGCAPWLIADVIGRACAMKRSLEAE